MLAFVLGIVLAAWAPPECERPSASALSTSRGATVAPGASCGTYLLSTDAAVNAPFAWGQFWWPEMLADGATVRIRWRRVRGDRARSIELHLPGAVLLLRDGAYGYWSSDAQFDRDGGYKPLPHYRTDREHEVAVVRHGAEVFACVDGKPLDVHRLEAAPTEERFSVGLKDRPGVRGSLWVRSLTVVPATTEPTVSKWPCSVPSVPG